MMPALHDWTGRQLYTLAIRADARLTTVIAARTAGQRTRWTLTPADERDYAISCAIREKTSADQLWLGYLAGCQRG